MFWSLIWTQFRSAHLLLLEAAGAVRTVLLTVQEGQDPAEDSAEIDIVVTIIHIVIIKLL